MALSGDESGSGRRILDFAFVRKKCGILLQTFGSAEFRDVHQLDERDFSGTHVSDVDGEHVAVIALQQDGLVSGISSGLVSFPSVVCRLDVC